MRSNHILLKVIPFVLAVVLLKLGAHLFGYGLISMNAIFSGLIGANIFLLGFLLSGVLTDFKESERLPGDMASTVHSIADELEYVYESKASLSALAGLGSLYASRIKIKRWFFKEVKTRELMTQLKETYAAMGRLEDAIAPNSVTRLKQEHSALRKMIIRAHTIRETSFVASGYLIATTTTFFLLAGLIFLKIEPFYESLFFVGLITYLMVFLILLIRDLDNPFGYYARSSSEDVSLKPLDDIISDLSRWEIDESRRDSHF